MRGGGGGGTFVPLRFNLRSARHNIRCPETWKVHPGSMSMSGGRWHAMCCAARVPGGGYRCVCMGGPPGMY